MSHIAGTPWKVSGSTQTTAIWVEDAGGQRVCTIRNCDVDLDRARLIAAAPELLEVLTRCLQHGNWLPEFVVLAREARAAIAKATGGK